MSTLKVPIFISIAGFILIFFINILVGNTIVRSMGRSLFYGASVFGIIFGISFAFKNFLGIDLEFNKIENDENSDNNVDIVVGEEDENEMMDDAGDVEDTEDYSGMETADDDNGSMAGYEESENETVEATVTNNKTQMEYQPEENDFERVDRESEKDAENNEYEDSDETDYSDDVDDGIDKLSNLSYESESNESEGEETDIDDTPEISPAMIKEKIGVDVSFEDIAKAIRTKLKSEE